MGGYLERVLLKLYVTNRIIYLFSCWCDYSFSPIVQQPLVGQGLLIYDVSRSHSNTPHLVGLLRTSDQPDAETSTRQQATLKRDKHPCRR
jgi:hypothetical protein